MTEKTNLLLLFTYRDKETRLPKINDNIDNFLNRRWQLHNVYVESFFETQVDCELITEKLFLTPKQYIIFEKEGKVKVESQNKNLLRSANFKFATMNRNNKLKKLILIQTDEDNSQFKWEIISISDNFLMINDISLKSKYYSDIQITNQFVYPEP